MQFHTLRTGWEVIRHFGFDEKFNLTNHVAAAQYFLDTVPDIDVLSFRHACFIVEWGGLKLPAFSLTPEAIDQLACSSLDFPGMELGPPIENLHHFLLRLPVDAPHMLHRDGFEVRAIGVSFQPCNREAKEPQTLDPGLTVIMDCGETTVFDDMPEIDYPIFTISAFPLNENSVAHSLTSNPRLPSLEMGDPPPAWLSDTAARVVTGFCRLPTHMLPPLERLPL